MKLTFFLLTIICHCFGRKCKLSFENPVEKSKKDHYIFTNTTSRTTVQITGEDCEMNILAVGGGGYGFGTDFFARGSGGGSGSVTFTTLKIAKNSKIEIGVGAHQEDSYVWDLNGNILAHAHCGLDGAVGWNTPGGNGYSGGGDYDPPADFEGYQGGHGASNGGNGGGQFGGTGSGANITAFIFENDINLTPGVGGKGWSFGGGGGGGVLVNGEGGFADGYAGGQGYGAGGAGGAGLQGVVIIEVKESQQFCTVNSNNRILKDIRPNRMLYKSQNTINLT